MKKIWTAAALAVLAGLASAAPEFTEEQLKARFYFDLGPAEVDVSKYPKKQQENYEVFKKTCSQCHTLARPINAPILARKDWERYLKRMHERSKSRPGKVISKKDARVIVEFLAYDSKVRKVDRKAEFEALTAELKSRFEQVQAERSRRQVEEDKKKVKEPAPYTGDKPNP